MKAIKSLQKTVVIGLAALLISAGIAQVATAATQSDAEFLTRWQATYDGLLKMKPKWGKQGVDAFKASLDAGVPIQFLDVRTPKEWQAGVIKNALLINLNKLPTPKNLAKLPEDRNTIIGIYCKAGHRSTLALAILHQLGYRNAINMSGGMQAWHKAGYPVEVFVVVQ